jgi:hypothetical protein
LNFGLYGENRPIPTVPEIPGNGENVLNYDVQNSVAINKMDGLFAERRGSILPSTIDPRHRPLSALCSITVPA